MLPQNSRYLVQRSRTNEEVKARIGNAISPYEDLLTSVKRHKLKWYGHVTRSSGAGIMEADDLQVTTVFTVQPSFLHRHSTNRVSRSFTIVGERRGEV